MYHNEIGLYGDVFPLLQNKVNSYSAVARIFLKGYSFYNQLKDKGYDQLEKMTRSWFMCQTEMKVRID